MKKLLKGGVIVGASGCRKADLLIDGERIEAVGEALSCPEAEVIDVSGKLLFPGFLDAHTHFDLEVCNTVTADDFYTGGRSALRGGTTTVIDFACPNKGETLHTGLARWHEKADGKTGCDYGFHMTIDDWNDGIRAELPQMFDEGISSFKMYMTYPAMMIGDEAMFHALREMKRLGGIVGVHCENAGMIDALIAEKKAAGALSPASHPLCRPAEAEAEAVGRLLKLARVADVPVMIVHLSTAAALREVEAARGLGQKVFVETCPHYLLLDETALEKYGPFARCNPPLRPKETVEKLWDYVNDGTIDFIGSDHGPFLLSEKEQGNEDIFKAFCGAPGVDLRLPLMLDAAARGKTTIERVVELLCVNPARCFNIYPQKGTISAGADADLVVFDMNDTTVVDRNKSYSKARETARIFDGWELGCKLNYTVVRGRVLMEDGVVDPDCAGYGQLVTPQK